MTVQPTSICQVSSRIDFLIRKTYWESNMTYIKGKITNISLLFSRSFENLIGTSKRRTEMSLKYTIISDPIQLVLYIAGMSINSSLDFKINKNSIYWFIPILVCSPYETKILTNILDTLGWSMFTTLSKYMLGVMGCSIHRLPQ